MFYGQSYQGGGGGGVSLVVTMLVEGLCSSYSTDGFVEARGFMKRVGAGCPLSFLFCILINV